jgi:hypothetical protein
MIKKNLIGNIFKVLGIMFTGIFSFGGTLQAQDSPCQITCSTVMPVCSESPVELSVPNNYLYRYNWYPDGQTTYSITVNPYETTEYSVEIRDIETDSLICQSDPFVVEVKPRFTIVIQQEQLTCSNSQEDYGKTAIVRASVTDGEEPPYTYKWDVSPLHISPNDPAIAIGLEANKEYTVAVTDGRGCTQTETILTKAFPNPVIEISCDPSDTIFIQNPHVSFSFENLSIDSIEISNFFWIFDQDNNITSTLPEPKYTYTETGDYIARLKVFNPQGCDTVYTKKITVSPIKLRVPNVFTPNGDGVNDYFIIGIDESEDSEPEGTRSGNLEYENFKPLNTYYETTELVIFNRWGRIVYKSSDYNNDWDGGNLPDATYFYVLKCHGFKDDVTYKGSVTIFGSGR